MPSLRDYSNLKAWPSISQSSICSKLLQGALHSRNTKHCSLQGSQEGSGQCCSPSAQGSEAPGHECSQCMCLRATKQTLHHISSYHSPWEAPCARSQEERHSSQCLNSSYSPVQGVKDTKTKQKSVQVLGGVTELSVVASSAPLGCFHCPLTAL